jgi:hypothetical protein
MSDSETKTYEIYEAPRHAVQKIIRRMVGKKGLSWYQSDSLRKAEESLPWYQSQQFYEEYYPDEDFEAANDEEALKKAAELQARRDFALRAELKRQQAEDRIKTPELALTNQQIRRILADAPLYVHRVARVISALDREPVGDFHPIYCITLDDRRQLECVDAKDAERLASLVQRKADRENLKERAFLETCYKRAKDKDEALRLHRRIRDNINEYEVWLGVAIVDDFGRLC